MNRIVLLSIVFPSIEPYLDDFFSSLEKQTLQDFDLLIINDGLKDFNAFKSRYRNLNMLYIDYEASPSKIREYGINYLAKKNYDFILFGDADDYFATNRVEVMARLLKNHDIVVTDYDVVNGNKNIIKKGYLSQRLENMRSIDLEYVRDKNIFGANTGLRKDILFSVEFDEKIIDVYWYFFSLLLAKGLRAVFTNETREYYRQHNLNTIGSKELDEEKILWGIRVKLLHYKEMAFFDKKYYDFYNSFSLLQRKIENDEDFKKDYMKRIKRQRIKNPLWWEEINLMGDLDES